jgi:hypothetical protein
LSADACRLSADACRLIALFATKLAINADFICNPYDICYRLIVGCQLFNANNGLTMFGGFRKGWLMMEMPKAWRTDFWADRRQTARQRSVTFIEHLISVTERTIWSMQDEDTADGIAMMSPADDRDLAALKREHAELCIVLSTLPNAAGRSDSDQVW